LLPRGSVDARWEPEQARPGRSVVAARGAGRVRWRAIGDQEWLWLDVEEEEEEEWW
jgi:hypothetical protein